MVAIRGGRRSDIFDRFRDSRGAQAFRPRFGSLPPADRGEFLGVKVDRLTFAEALARARSAMAHGERLQHADLNVAKFVACRTDEKLHRYIANSDLICVDGMGILFTARLLGIDLGERVAGIDLMYAILDLCEKEGFRPYFLGAREDVLERALSAVRRSYPRIRIAGSRHGYFAADEEAEIVRAIRRSEADCLFVGISSPIKERFLSTHRDALGVPLQIGVGGAFDILAGDKRRAPIWMQRMGLEWLFRMLQEPRRLGPRYLSTNLQFARIVWLSLIPNFVGRKVL